MKLHCFMLMGAVDLAVLPQLDPSLISASAPLILYPLSFLLLLSFLSPHYHWQVFANREIPLLHDGKDRGL